MIHSSIIIVYVCMYKYMILLLYSIQWQASHGNWSCYAYADKPASIWMIQIIKNLHSMTCCYG